MAKPPSNIHEKLKKINKSLFLLHKFLSSFEQILMGRLRINGNTLESTDLPLCNNSFSGFLHRGLATAWGDSDPHTDRSQRRCHRDLTSRQPGGHLLIWLNGNVLIGAVIECLWFWFRLPGTNIEPSFSGSPLGRAGWDLPPYLHRARELRPLCGFPGTGRSALMFTLHLFLIYFITQRIVSGDFGGEVHLWDLRSKDGKFEVANHRKWECHKVGSKATLANRAITFSTGVISNS